MTKTAMIIILESLHASIQQLYATTVSLRAEHIFKQSQKLIDILQQLRKERKEEEDLEFLNNGASEGDSEIYIKKHGRFIKVTGAFSSVSKCNEFLENQEERSGVIEIQKGIVYTSLIHDKGVEKL